MSLNCPPVATSHKPYQFVGIHSFIPLHGPVFVSILLYLLYSPSFSRAVCCSLPGKRCELEH